MTLADLEQHARRLPLLYGEECLRVSLGEDGAVGLDFALLHLPGADAEPRREKYLDVSCPWRLETRASVLAGDGDSAPFIAHAIQILRGRRLNNATIYRPSYMTRLDFDDLFLWLFPSRSTDFMIDGAHRVPWYVGGHAFDGESPFDWR
jgi:hypothetical protein